MLRDRGPRYCILSYHPKIDRSQMLKVRRLRKYGLVSELLKINRTWRFGSWMVEGNWTLTKGFFFFSFPLLYSAKKCLMREAG